MCGIIGCVGKITSATPLLLEGLKRLEYRGYDSAGIATLGAEGQLYCRRAAGKLNNLIQLVEKQPVFGSIGIGHTRWATHGAATEHNAHPHTTESVAVVHNGIIENYHQLRKSLEASGCVFTSQTDTEIIAHLVTQFIQKEKLSPLQAVTKTLSQLTGAFALAFIFSGHTDLLIGARRGSPLAVGYGDNLMLLGSDATAFNSTTNYLSYLEEGDLVVLSSQEAIFYDEHGHQVQRPTHTINSSISFVGKENYRHYMAKEIHEQPEVIGHALSHYIDFEKGSTKPLNLPFDWSQLTRLTISACGTAYYAGLIAKYWFERLARLPVDIDVASEFRYREYPLSKNGFSLFISQSGETADTLAALRYCKSQHQFTGVVVNVPNSTMVREADVHFPILAGPEICVASTKAFTCQLAVLLSLAIQAGRARNILNLEQESDYISMLTEIPRYILEALSIESKIEKLSRHLAKTSNVLYLGRGLNYPLALEGALKLKELSYIHAEGYPAGELKHGPLALIDEKICSIVIAPHDGLFEKTVSNMQEVSARGGQIILITDKKGADSVHIDTIETLILPDVPSLITPLIFAIPIQLLAYYTAVTMGTDVDQPRNLAKSVTVE